MRHLLRILVPAIALATGSCTEPTGPADELASARERWEKWGPSSYTATIRYLCGECVPGAAMPVVVTVQDGQIVSRIYVASGLPVAESLFALFPDVEGLFDVIRRNIEEGAYQLEVEYDPATGYPRVISVDLHPQMVDDEFAYLTQLTPP